MSDNARVLFEHGKFRICEYLDADPNAAEHVLDGDYNAEEREHLIDLIAREGIYGYVLESWDARVGGGWVHVDSCWGFVGQYTPTEETFNHYIVDEMKRQIPGL